MVLKDILTLLNIRYSPASNYLPLGYCYDNGTLFCNFSIFVAFKLPAS